MNNSDHLELSDYFLVEQSFWDAYLHEATLLSLVIKHWLTQDWLSRDTLRRHFQTILLDDLLQQRFVPNTVEI